MNTENIIEEGLNRPQDATAYFASREISRILSDKAIIEGDASGFDLEAFVRAELCYLERKPNVHNQITTAWMGKDDGLARFAENAWYEATWEGHRLDVLLVSWSGRYSRSRYFWIGAETREIAEQFYTTVCEWTAEVRGEVLVFDQGCWYKSEELFEAIKGSSFDNLILQGELKADIRSDFARFFESRAIYERYGIPWKRGVLLLGPPGNGKTHTIKALVNWMSHPCLYVKSFTSQYGTDHSNIHSVFERARKTTPCVLVLEDLDALINERNRSFFLNELDGFAANTGIVVVATTNHPERLDPAILDRPSRFDRKYHFELPGLGERSAFLRLWNNQVDPQTRLSDDGLKAAAEQTEGFSFAYLKELWISSLSRWIVTPVPGAMDRVMLEVIQPLCEQMASHPEEPAPLFGPGDDDEVVE